jgi:glutathione reductase (NADPH)
MCALCVSLAAFAALIANKAKEISRLNSVYVNLLRNAGVAYYEGKGSLLDKNTVQVGCAEMQW